jgi:hypothetical protein
MATIINNPPDTVENTSTSSSGVGIVLGVLLVILLVVLFAVFGFGGSRSSTNDSNIEIPRSVDVNVNPGAGTVQ